MTHLPTQLHLGTEHAYGGARRPFSVPTDTLLRHAFVIGQTGVGKTTFLLNLLGQLIEQGAGVGFLDPHGHAAEALLELIPRRRTRGVVYLRPTDIGRPIGMNPLENVPEGSRHQRASAVGESIRALHADSWGDRLDWILYNSLRALLDTPGSTLLDVPRLLVDEAFRDRVIRSTRDSAVRSFWLDEFASYDRAFRTIAVSPVQNKVGKLCAHPPLRAVLGQPQSRLDLGEVLARGQVLVANLAGIGQHSADLLGSLLLSGLLERAMERQPSAGIGRPIPFYLVIDEAHRFTTESVVTALSEARKYGFGLILADQYLDQISLEIQQAVLGNVGSLISFRVGGPDSLRLDDSSVPRSRPRRSLNSIPTRPSCAASPAASPWGR